CPENIWCDGAQGNCQPGRMEGEACGVLATSPKLTDANCAVHLWCDAAPLGMGKCHAPSAEGGPCTSTLYACQDGLHCSGYVSSGVSATLGTCQPPAAAGGDCQLEDDCQQGLACVSDKCSAPGDAGAACNQTADCAAGLVCGDDAKCA